MQRRHLLTGGAASQPPQPPRRRPGWPRVDSEGSSSSNPQRRHSIARLTSLRRRCVLAAMLVSVCLAAALGAADGSISTPASHPHEAGAGAGAAPSVSELLAPQHLQVGTSLYVRSDLLAAHSKLIPVGSRSWWVCLVGTFACVCLAALAAGLTIGLVSIDPFDLALILATEEEDCTSGEEIRQLREDKRYAEKLLPLVQQHHLLLVTLLICNACANELLPLLLDKLVPSYLAVLLSVTFVLIFGEILPSSIFTGPSQMKLASAMTPVVWTLITITYVLAQPIAWVLDHMLGVEDEGRLRRSELKSLIRMQGNASANALASGLMHSPSPSPDPASAALDHSRGVLLADEVSILHGALEMRDKKIRDCYTPIDDVFMLSLDDILDIDMCARIVAVGHSRIPVYENDRHNIRGVLLVKRLIVLNPEDKRPVRSIACRWPLICSPDLGLLSLMNNFQLGRSHLAIVCDQPDEMMAALRENRPVPSSCDITGIVTLEDLMEILIKEDISDETDVGVRAIMEHSAFVKKRIKKLSMLAAAQVAEEHRLATAVAAVARTPSFRLRSGSLSSRAAADSAAASLRVLNALTPQSSRVAEEAAAYGYQAADAATAIMPLGGGAGTAVASVGDLKLDVHDDGSNAGSPHLSHSQLQQHEQQHPESTRLLRDGAFSKSSRKLLLAVPQQQSSSASTTPVASHTPTGGHVPAAAAASAAASAAHPPLHHYRSPSLATVGSLLTPRAFCMSEGMTRRDLHPATIAAIKRMGSTADLHAAITAQAQAATASATNTSNNSSSSTPTRTARSLVAQPPDSTPPPPLATATPDDEETATLLSGTR